MSCELSVKKSFIIHHPEFILLTFALYKKIKPLVETRGPSSTPKKNKVSLPVKPADRFRCLKFVEIRKKYGKQSQTELRKKIMSWYGFESWLLLLQRRQTYNVVFSLASVYAILFWKFSCKTEGIMVTD